MRPVKFVKSHDGLSIAWTRSGTGPPLVKSAAWLTHLEHDAESPVWSHWVRFLEGNFDYLRYDERGCGLSDRRTGDLSLASWVDDLERVVEAARMPRPFALLAMSQGSAAAIQYAARHPQDVSHLVLCGGYARGIYLRGTPEAARLYDAVIDVLSIGWDQPNEAFRDLFTKKFIPSEDPQKIRWFNELCRKTTSAEIGAELMRARRTVDVSDVLGAVACPTLICHAQEDFVVPLDEGKLLAREIPGSELVILQTQNHILQDGEPAWEAFCREMLCFVKGRGQNETTESEFRLTGRERDVLAGVCAAKSNKQIARDLGMSEKTVRNLLTTIFRKIDVTGRQQAILKMVAPPHLAGLQEQDAGPEVPRRT